MLLANVGRTEELTKGVLWYENYDLHSIVTPVDAIKLNKLLKKHKFNASRREYLFEGFTSGFSLKYGGETKIRKTAPNLKLHVGSQLELWNKVMVEVQAGRFAGPFKDPPFDYFIQFPIGLVPKDGGKKTRLIFHLSYPKTGTSVNSCIPDEECTVHYPDFEQAVKMCLHIGKNAKMAKSDMSRAFRNVPMDRESFRYLVMKCKHPVTGITYWFTDKCLPFGSSISCAIFQNFSNAVSFWSERLQKRAMSTT